MPENYEQSNIYSLDDHRRPFSDGSDTTQFEHGNIINFRLSNLRPVDALVRNEDLFVKTPLEKPRTLAEQSVESIASIGSHLALVRRDHMDKNWSIDEIDRPKVSYLSENYQEVA